MHLIDIFYGQLTIFELNSTMIQHIVLQMSLDLNPAKNYRKKEKNDQLNNKFI